MDIILTHAYYTVSVPCSLISVWYQGHRSYSHHPCSNPLKPFLGPQTPLTRSRGLFFIDWGKVVNTKGWSLVNPLLCGWSTALLTGVKKGVSGKPEGPGPEEMEGTKRAHRHPSAHLPPVSGIQSCSASVEIPMRRKILVEPRASRTAPGPWGAVGRGRGVPSTPRSTEQKLGCLETLQIFTKLLLGLLWQFFFLGSRIVLIKLHTLLLLFVFCLFH